MDYDKINKEEYPLPLKVIIDVNWDCSLNCIMCVKRGIKKPSGQQPFKQFKSIVDKLPWIREVSLGALGDAFAYKDLGEAMLYLLAKKIISPLTSNLVDLNDDNIKYLSSNSPLYVSIDGGTNELYKSIRGKDALTLIKNNLIKLRKEKPDVHVAINHLVFNNNLEEAKELIDFLAQLRIPITFFYPIHFYKDLEAKLDVWNNQSKLYKQLVDLDLYCKINNVSAMIPSPIIRERKCFRVFEQPIIAYDGTVYPCDFIYQQMNDWVKPEWDWWFKGEVTKVPQHQYMMGNINNKDFITMWNSEKWKKLRALLTELNNGCSNKSYDELKKEVDIKEEFNFCKVCPARWSICL